MIIACWQLQPKVSISSPNFLTFNLQHNNAAVTLVHSISPAHVSVCTQPGGDARGDRPACNCETISESLPLVNNFTPVFLSTQTFGTSDVA